MTRITAMIIATNYPDNIYIDGYSLYLLREDRTIHRCLSSLDIECNYTKDVAEAKLHEIAQQVCDYYKKGVDDE